MAQGGTSPSPQPPKAPSRPPTGGECYICNRPFGSHSLRIHERQCLKRWRIENDALPPDMRAPEPVRKAATAVAEQQQAAETRAKQAASPVAAAAETVAETETAASGGRGSGGPGSAGSGAERQGSARGSPLFPCYLCGRLFTVHSIYIHEPQCLQAWRRENDALPPSKRRPEPLKPDIKFTRDGRVDYDAVNEANWQCHLSQLVPCKFCSRTFNPDRVHVHEKSCKG